MAHTVATLIPFIGEERDTVKKVSELLRESKLDDRQKSELQKSTSDAESEFKATIEEYHDLAEVVRQWHATHPGWRGAMLLGKVEYAWAQHLLRSKQAKLQEATLAKGFRPRLESSLAHLKQAALLCAETKQGSNGVYESEELLSIWFEEIVHMSSDRAGGSVDADEVFRDIQEWLVKLPKEENLAIRNKLLLQVLERMTHVDPENNAKETEVFYQVTGGAKLLGDLQGASELKKRVNAFNELRSEIEFVVVPDGAIYREGTWAEAPIGNYPVGDNDFGIWLTLKHTAQARERSGGFRRYTQNEQENVGVPLDGSSATNYANDMKSRLHVLLDGLFQVVHVAPLPMPVPVRRFKNDWLETPLFYVILSPMGDVRPNKLPPLAIDLKFTDSGGSYLLPFKSLPVTIDCTKDEPTRLDNLKITQRLQVDRQNVTKGVVQLEITSQGPMIPPAPATLFPDLYPSGFEKSKLVNQDEIEVAFSAKKVGALVTRKSTTGMRWIGSSSATDFVFPAGQLPESAEITRLVWWPGKPGESLGDAVVGNAYRIGDLPSQPLSWQRIALGVAACACVLLVVWLVYRLPQKMSVAKRPKPLYVLPDQLTALGGIWLLRKVASDPRLAFSHEQREELDKDIARLESAGGAEPEVMLKITRKWVDAAALVVHSKPTLASSGIVA